MSVKENTIAFLEQQLSETESEMTAAKAEVTNAKKAAKQMIQEANQLVDAKDTRVTEISEFQESLKETIKELKGSSRKKAKVKPVKKAEASTKKVTVKQQHVREACLVVIDENPGMEQGDFENFVKQKLGEDEGLDLRGFCHRFGEVMNQGLFAIDETGHVTLDEPKNETIMKPGTSLPSEMAVESLTESTSKS